MLMQQLSSIDCSVVHCKLAFLTNLFCCLCPGQRRKL